MSFNNLTVKNVFTIFKELQEKGLLETLIAKAEKKKTSVPELISEIVKKGK